MRRPDSAGGIREPADRLRIAGVFSKKSADIPYILVIHCETTEQEKEIRNFVEASVKRMSLKSKSVSPGRIETEL